MPKQSTLQTAIALKNAKKVSGQDIDNVCETDGKIFARINWLQLWKKNPRIAETKQIKKLEKQVKELGIYKPLIITPDGEILGGNHRYKVLKELSKKDKRYNWVWVSIVEAWTDEERLKYALSDNDQIAKYSREQLKDLLEPFKKQKSLFVDYNINLEGNQSIDNFINDIALSKDELKFKEIKKNLQAMGLNEETLDTLETMTTHNKAKEKLTDINLKGKIIGQKFPLMFWIDDETIFEQLKIIFDTGYKDKHDSDKLIKITEKQLKIKLPTDKDKIKELNKKIEKLNKEIGIVNKIGSAPKKEKEILAKRKEIKKEIERLNTNYFSMENIKKI